MRYRIGELADLFGMTKEGVRYLERQGIISSIRDEKNGYRYFQRDAITRLKQIRRFQSLGFSLEEAQDMICETPRDQIEDRLRKKLQELEEKEKQIRRMKELLAVQQQITQRLMHSEEQFFVDMRPDMLFFPRVEDEASVSTPQERMQISQDRIAEKAWIFAAPPCTLGAMHYGGDGRRVLGSIVRTESAQAVNLPIVSRVIHLEPCLCVCGVVESPLGQPPEISGMLAYAEEQGFERNGDVYGILWLNYCDESGRRWGIHEVYMPVCEIGNKNA